jgi:hypothetical protein
VSHKLKRDILRLAGCLAPSEAISRQQTCEPLVEIVANVCALPGATPVQLALIALTLAKHIEVAEPS